MFDNYFFIITIANIEIILIFCKYFDIKKAINLIFTFFFLQKELFKYLFDTNLSGHGFSIFVNHNKSKGKKKYYLLNVDTM